MNDGRDDTPVAWPTVRRVERDWRHDATERRLRELDKLMRRPPEAGIRSRTRRRRAR